MPDRALPRILMVVDFYPPVIGGRERHVQTLSRELVQRGYSVAVATLWHEGSPAFEVDEGVRVYRLNGWNKLLKRFYTNLERPFHPTLPDPGVVRELGHVILRERPDVIHARGWMLYSVLPLKLWSGAKLVVTLHDYALVCPRVTYMYQGETVCTGPAYAKCVSCAAGQYGPIKSAAITTGLHISGHGHSLVDRYLAISTAVQRVSARGTGGRPIDVVPTFIPDSALQPQDHGHRPGFLPPGDGYVLFVGALTRAKGVHVLLEAYEMLGADVPLVVLGTSWADTPPTFPPNVTVVRDVPHADVMRAWAHCSVGVVPSLWPEPFGQVAIEAMASGRPIVASAIGGLCDAVADGLTGILVPPGDPAALRDALARLLGSRELREEMGRAGRERSRLFMASTVVTEVERVYAQALGGA